MDYGSLTADKSTPGSLGYWCNYAQAVSEAPEIIQQAQTEIFSRLRVREMRRSLSLNLALGDSSAPLPDGFLDTINLRDPYGTPLRRVSEDRLDDMRTYDDTGAMQSSYPGAYALFDEAFQFDCAAQAAITIRGLYYGAVYISDKVPTSFLTTRYSALFRAMLLKHAYAFRKDWTAVQGYANQVEKYLSDVAMQDDLSYRGLDDADAEFRL